MSAIDFERREAMDEAINNQRHVVDELSRGVWISLAIGACERFTFYAISAPWRMYNFAISTKVLNR